MSSEREWNSPRLGGLARRYRDRPGHDEAAMACVRGEQAVKPHQMSSRARHQRRQPGNKVERLEQDVGGAIAKRVLQLVDHQAVAVTAKTLTRKSRARHIPAQALELTPLVAPAGNRRIEREAVALGRQRLYRRAPFEASARGVQA